MGRRWREGDSGEIIPRPAVVTAEVVEPEQVRWIVLPTPGTVT